MIISGATATLFEVLTAIITVLRVYAISGRNRLVTAVLVLLFLVEIGYDIHGNTLARLNMADDCLLSYGLITPMLNDCVRGISIFRRIDMLIRDTHRCARYTCVLLPV
ncbi:hypothetical protein C8Q72DRAFT_863950 [Fomitopsis betulina]|nr:hypothetical protein C8Q72DRAFT_863950 [Fomitopsis betulina]